MYAPLVEHFRARGFHVLREVPTHQGYVDVLAVKLDERAVDTRWNLGVTGTMLSASLVRAWQALPQYPRKASLDTWAATLSVRTDTLRKVAKELESLGFVSISDAKTCARIFLPRLTRKIVCCEAKLRAWQQGARQAYSHRFYSNQSYLALSRVSSAVDLTLLTAKGIGLLKVDSPKVVIHEEAPALIPNDGLMLRQLEELVWADLVSERAGATGRKRSRKSA